MLRCSRPQSRRAIERQQYQHRAAWVGERVAASGTRQTRCYYSGYYYCCCCRCHAGPRRMHVHPRSTLSRNAAADVLHARSLSKKPQHAHRAVPRARMVGSKQRCKPRWHRQRYLAHMDRDASSMTRVPRAVVEPGTRRTPPSRRGALHCRHRDDPGTTGRRLVGPCGSKIGRPALHAVHPLRLAHILHFEPT